MRVIYMDRYGVSTIIFPTLYDWHLDRREIGKVLK